MKNILVCLGARYLGHAVPLVFLLNAVKHKFPHCKISIVNRPLNPGETPSPVMKTLQKNGYHVDESDSFISESSIKPQLIKTYFHLFQRQNIENKDQFRLIIKYFLNKIEKIQPDLIVCDSIPGIPQLSKFFEVPCVCLRSHALRPQLQQNVWRDHFLDTILEREEIDQEKHFLKYVKETFKRLINMQIDLLSSDELLYQECVITPGFSAFDFESHYASHNIFMRLGDLQNNRISTRLEYCLEPGLIYIRDEKRRQFLCDALKKDRIDFVVLESDQQGRNFNPWQQEHFPAFMISHGGHGMAIACLYQEIPHLILADNADRLGIGERISEKKWGLHLDWREINAVRATSILVALKNLPKQIQCRSLINDTSLTPSETVKQIEDFFNLNRAYQ